MEYDGPPTTSVPLKTLAFRASRGAVCLSNPIDGVGGIFIRTLPYLWSLAINPTDAVGGLFIPSLFFAFQESF